MEESIRQLNCPVPCLFIIILYGEWPVDWNIVLCRVFESLDEALWKRGLGVRRNKTRKTLAALLTLSLFFSFPCAGIGGK